MDEVERLAASDVVALADLFFDEHGYARPILRGGGLGLLDAAVHRAEALAYYEGADLIAQAAVICHGIVTNHAFVDGNKRAAWIASVTFLELNGYALPDGHDEAFADLIIALYEQEDHSGVLDQITDWLRTHVAPVAS